MPNNEIPDAPKIYHITHLDNLPSLINAGCLWSDAETLRQSLLCTTVGMSDIKKRRLEELEVTCHPGTKVGEYVPFYFCPRSIMLYLLHRGNHPKLHYRGGQRPIIHLEADLGAAIKWAEANRQKWAFSASNAGASYTRFYSRLMELNQVNWGAVAAADWQDSQIKEGKQAEYLQYGSFPWHLFQRIGAIDAAHQQAVQNRLANASHVPQITVEPGWYY